jgi:hypothetical protein
VLHFEWIRLYSWTTQLNKYTLNHNGRNENNDEPFVSEETSEHVQLFFANLSRVNQVEYLHEYEHLEDYSVVKHLLSWNQLFLILREFDICITDSGLQTCCHVKLFASFFSLIFQIEAVEILQ